MTNMDRPLRILQLLAVHRQQVSQALTRFANAFDNDHPKTIRLINKTAGLLSVDTKKFTRQCKRLLVSRRLSTMQRLHLYQQIEDVYVSTLDLSSHIIERVDSYIEILTNSRSSRNGQYAGLEEGHVYDLMRSVLLLMGTSSEVVGWDHRSFDTLRALIPPAPLWPDPALEDFWAPEDPEEEE